MVHDKIQIHTTQLHTKYYTTNYKTTYYNLYPMKPYIRFSPSCFLVLYTQSSYRFNTLSLYTNRPVDLHVNLLLRSAGWHGHSGASALADTTFPSGLVTALGIGAVGRKTRGTTGASLATGLSCAAVAGVARVFGFGRSMSLSGGSNVG